jgi:hypothetical protein
MKTLTTVLVLGAVLIASGQTPLVEIAEPVATEFAVYTPQPVTVTPQAPACDVGAQLEKVTNLKAFTLSDQARTLLQKNRFVVTPARRPLYMSSTTGYNELFDIYCENRDNGVPNFITTDALLHTYHLCFDYILRTCEEQRFIAQLNQLLNGLLDETIRQIAASREDDVRSSLNMNLNYLIVARKLLDSTYVEPINGGPYLQELGLIAGAAGFADSPIFGYTEDYSQYIVRGHYTRTALLKRYFQSMMWLGRMTFSCENAQDPASRVATRSALLLLQSMRRLQINSYSAMTVWDEIYQPTVFFVGKSDDINPLNYLPLIDQVYGPNWAGKTPDLFHDDDLLNAFFSKTESLPGAAIPYPGQPDKGFRFMGQRFIPDSWMFSELVFPKVPSRFMPTGLDVMQILGSQRAYDHLPEKDKMDPAYHLQLDKLKTEFAGYPAADWAQNLYWNWLYTLMPLLTVKSEGYPEFMRTLAWQDKDLFCALASWAELRHDTILYAKPSGTKTGLPPSALTVQGYVEPNPHLFARLASLAAFMKEGLATRGLLFSDFAPTLDLFIATSLQLKEIAEKELTDEPLTSIDYALIFDMGKTLYRIATFGKGGGEGPAYNAERDGLEPMPVIADVHTDANSGQVLEEGSGYPYAIYVLCHVEGQAVLTRGAGYSYHEFTWPMNDRLTDEKWRKQLTSNNPPSPASWCSRFVSDLPAWNVLPTFYQWQKPNAFIFQAMVDSAQYDLEIGDSLHLVIRSGQEMNIQPPSIHISSQAGSWRVTNIKKAENQWPATFAASYYTGALPAGLYYINIALPAQGDTLRYRSHFYLSSATSVPSFQTRPETIELSANWPNPFNNSTVFSLNLPSADMVHIAVYNIKGEYITSLMQGRLAAGQHTLRWDGTDRNGQPMPTATYLVRCIVGNRQFAHSLTLIK